MTSPEAGESELRPSEWWAQLKAQQQRWSVAPPPRQGPGRDNRRRIAVAATIGVLLVIGGVVLGVELSGSDGNATATAAAATSTTPAAPQATISGWHVVVNAVPDDAAANDSNGTVAVDVPANWTVGPVTGADGRTTVRASMGDGACVGLPQSRRAAVTQTADAAADQRKAVTNIVQAFLHDTGYANFRPQAIIGSPRATTDGSFQDYKVTVTMLPPPPPLPPGVPPPPAALSAPPGCIPPSEILHVVAKSDADGTFAVLVAGDQQIAGAPAASDLDKIAATVRTP